MNRCWRAAAVATVFAAAACKPESAARSDRAAREVASEQVDVVQAGRAGTHVADEVHELSEATQRFEAQRDARIHALRARYAVIAPQPLMIGTVARDLPITDAARGDINDKLHRLQMRLDEMQNMIEGLARTAVEEWERRDGEATAAMQRLEDARRDAWRALEQAPHIDHNAS